MSQIIVTQDHEATLEHVQFPYEYSSWPFIQSKLQPMVQDPKSITKQLVIDIIESIKVNHFGKPKKEDENPDKYLVLYQAMELFEEQYYPDDYNSDDFLSTVIPFIAHLVLKSEDYLPKQSIQYLKKGESKTLTISKLGAACILANSFFCTWYRLSYDPLWKYFPSINYDEMYGKFPNFRPQFAKTMMLLNYFARVHKSFADYSSNPNLGISFTRHYLTPIPSFEYSDLPLCDVHVNSQGSIADSHDAVQIDFANKFIGGASISFGCVQEEIEFSLCPEMNIARLFCHVMGDRESILITGAEQYSKHKGYAFSLDYAGNFIDLNKDSNGNSLKQTSAIDALIFNKLNFLSQWEKETIDREIIKSLSGFSSSKTMDKISTGNWGCGAFLGDVELKAIIQVISASLAQKSLVYYSFQRKEVEVLAPLVEDLNKQGITVGALYQSLLKVKQFASNNQVATFTALRKLLL
ncbi:poly (ADP-ribose) glycohydrolase [Naegleria gruberi]|uniref:poly(ADP-ribose) glycohydrolase n=1 Tax=Naegleria gruberi TaxID=5762 RepID=D2VUU6_NAEGR|nr:poly (ADP-ribose) glycohydrolase [Naegleria gruberi]EFC39385.1 poly (ADP-ribose) glycohydrolase [Naegleria gruberi]|eukprot:XP_002672129.1 poly (ADP-ribose) glycohydrolase [Naegleria gruberi strain NEG-M]